MIENIGIEYFKIKAKPEAAMRLKYEVILTTVGQSLNLKCKVPFKTRDGEGNETTGAYIKYHLVGNDKNVSTSRAPTGTTIDLDIGNYQYWSERDGKKTSIARTKRFTKSDESPVIVTESDGK